MTCYCCLVKMFNSLLFLMHNETKMEKFEVSLVVRRNGVSIERFELHSFQLFLYWALFCTEMPMPNMSVSEKRTFENHRQQFRAKYNWMDEIYITKLASFWNVRSQHSLGTPFCVVDTCLRSNVTMMNRKIGFFHAQQVADAATIGKLSIARMKDLELWNVRFNFQKDQTIGDIIVMYQNNARLGEVMFGLKSFWKNLSDRTNTAVLTQNVLDADLLLVSKFQKSLFLEIVYRKHQKYSKVPSLKDFAKKNLCLAISRKVWQGTVPTTHHSKPNQGKLCKSFVSVICKRFDEMGIDSKEIAQHVLEYVSMFTCENLFNIQEGGLLKLETCRRCCFCRQLLN